MKNKRGITLVALIITIVVLLILAIVSIGVVRDSKIIAHAQDANSKYTIGQEKEQIGLAVSEWNIQKVIPENAQSFYDAVSAALNGTANVKDNGDGILEVEFNNTGNRYKVEDNGKIVPVEITLITFTINPTPSDATVTINGVETKTITVEENTEVNWSVSKSHYVTQEGSEIVASSNNTLEVILNPIMVTFAINPTPSDATVTINGVETKTVTVQEGSSINYSVSKEYYITTEETVSATDSIIDVSLSEKPISTLRVIPSSIANHSSADGLTNLSNAASGHDDDDSYARGGMGKIRGVVWTFSGNNIGLNENAKIKSLRVRYRVGVGASTTVATEELTCGSVKDTDTSPPSLADDMDQTFDISLDVSSLSASYINSNGVTLTVVMPIVNILTSVRFYGATLYINYQDF